MRRAWTRWAKLSSQASRIFPVRGGKRGEGIGDICSVAIMSMPGVSTSLTIARFVPYSLGGNVIFYELLSVLRSKKPEEPFAVLKRKPPLCVRAHI